MQITLPAFGAIIPGQGGRFAAIMRGPVVDGVEQPPYALLLADKSTEVARAIWGEYQEIAGTGSRTNGQENTAAMNEAKCPAAVKARAVRADGHSDFYLPSLGELNAAAANVPELFESDGVYWSSTQYSRDDAFVQDFQDGDSSWVGKDSKFRVRAVRQIPLELLNA